MSHLDCHCFFNFLVDESVGKLHLNACAGIPEEEANKIEWLGYGAAVCGCVARDRERIVAEDIFNTPDIRTELVKSYGIQAYACHPLMVQGKLIGTLSFGTRTRKHFSSDDLALMRTVTDQVAVAMERIRLIGGLRKSRDELELRVEERTTELKTFMARLEQSNQALQDFASIASHDLQEPLRKVGTFGSMLKQKYSEVLEEQGNSYLYRVLDANQRMQSLQTGLLEYSRVTTKANPFVKVDLREIVTEVLSDLEVRIQGTSAEVRVAELPVVDGDPTQMRQVFQNLIGNALKFHKEGEKPVIEVWSAEADGNLQIVVEDNGIGFEEQYLGKIFAPFQRLHGRSSQYEGTGMGLTICKKIVERHGGSITAKSTPDTGAKFIIQFPMT
jgi:signal transduction histidine kinase